MFAKTHFTAISSLRFALLSAVLLAVAAQTADTKQVLPPAATDTAREETVLPFEQARLGMTIKSFRKLYPQAVRMTGLNTHGITGALPPQGAVEKWLVRTGMRDAHSGNFEFFNGQLYHVNLSFPAGNERFKALKKELENCFGRPTTNKYLYNKWEISDSHMSITLSLDSATGANVSFTHLGIVAAILEYKRSAD